MYFGDYNTEMFQKLWPKMKYKQCQANETIFNKSDPASLFYFIVRGTVHILETSSTGEDKIAKIHNINQVFGLDKSGTWNSDLPNRDKMAVSESQTDLLVIDALDYLTIRSQRVLSAAEQKVEYLTQNIPGMRVGKSEIIQELETLFTKEVISKGYRIMHQDKYNEDLYFIVQGEWRALFNYNSNKQLKLKFDSLDESLPSLILIGTLVKGDWFGQSSSIQREKCKYSVQVSSDELIAYKISAKQFYDNFGRDNGAPIQRMRGKAITDNNWLKMVIKRLQNRQVGQIMSEWEFVDKVVNSTATRRVQQESPMVKKKQVGSISDISKLEERKRRKEELMAPFINKNKPAGRPMPDQSSSGSDMETKYKDLLGFGTPGIRAGKRLKHMDQDQLKSHLSLQRICGSGPNLPQCKDKDANNFSKAKASDFFKKTRAAELEMKNKAEEKASGSSGSGGASMMDNFSKFDKINAKKNTSVKNKLFGLE